MRGCRRAPEQLRCSLAVRREDICYLSWVIDSYDGIGFLVTDDAERGLVSVLLSRDYRGELESLLDALESEGLVMERLGIREQ
ncbi:MAG: DUF4911 domain-containing protein [Synergistaceae bacterium]|jgi:hypothetical protein|nr:DUF4911 domain-containing protein [Synergistaceae bacterium]